MIPDGIYRIYQLRFDEADRQHRTLAARFLIQDGHLHHLEDHKSMGEDFPEGPIAPEVERHFKMLQHSGYYEVIHESDVAAGHHPEEVPLFDLGDCEAEHKFVVTGDGLAEPSHVEMWDDAIEVDGRRLSEHEAHHLLSEVASGRLVLTPVD